MNCYLVLQWDLYSDQNTDLITFLYYTIHLFVTNHCSDVKPKEIEKQSPIKTFKSTRSKPVKKSGNNTESENDTDGETVTGRDLSQPEREESPFDPDNPDPNVS